MIGDGAYPSLLQGVSQQVLHLRREGQLESQTNMLADAVTGLRRRPGTLVRSNVTGNFNVGTIGSFHGEYEGESYHVILDSAAGTVRVFNSSFTQVSLSQNDYLKAPNISSLRTTNVGGFTWICNVTKTPTLGAASADSVKRNPLYDGWYVIRLGAFSKSYSIRVRSPGFNKEYTFVTPDGTNAGDAGRATAGHIARQIRLAMLDDPDFTAKYEAFVEDSGAVFITRAGKDTDNSAATTVTTTAGDIYALGSQSSNLPTRDLLPPQISGAGHDSIMTIGTQQNALSYFRWDFYRSLWSEVSAFGSSETLSNMPVRFTIENGVGVLESPVFEGRISGDEENNPYPAFLDYGISGISAYQGRLVLLANGYVCMSASNRPLRFMRASAVDLVNSDAIEISAGSVVNSAFEYAVPFNKDLLLVSTTNQAVIPAGSTGITPYNAMVVLSTETAIDTLAAPTVMGRTLMYATGTGAEFVGIGEIVPSEYSDSQYTTQNLTEHIPRYVSGRCRGIISSSSSSIGLFLSTGDPTVILVDEYLWVGAERIQNAWYEWRFPMPVLSAHFVQGQVVVVMKSTVGLVVCTMDPRSASYQQAGTIPPFLDVYSTVNVVDNKLSIPSYLRSAALLDKLALAHPTGDLSGEPIGIDNIDTSTWEITTVRSFRNGTVALGLLYSSSFAPSPPLFRDREGRPELTAHTNVLRYVLSVKNTGEFNVLVDAGRESSADLNQDASAILWSSTDLGLGQKQAVAYGTVYVPVRALSDRSSCTCVADNTRELNVTSIEYTIRGVRRRTRV